MLIRLSLFVCFVLCGFYTHAQQTYYVRENGTGQGTSWSDAAGSLQAMINKCSPGERVYVAAGNYFSSDGDLVVDERGKGTDSRQRSFVMKEGVAVYGGFAGVDMSETPQTRAAVVGAKYKWQLTSASVLSGERRIEGTKDDWHFDVILQRWIPSGYLMDNSLHVVWFATAGFNGLVLGEATEALPLSRETILDGFVIEGGAADGNSSDGGAQGHSARFGGGVYLAENGVLRNCVVRNNYAHTRGGGVFMNGGGLVSDCMIERNATPGGGANHNGFGGGAYVLGKGKIERSFVVNNSSRVGAGVYFAKDKRVLPYEMQMDMSIVANNSAAHEAGGVYCDRGGVLAGVTIVNNHTVSLNTLSHGLTGGLFCNEYGVVVNSILWGNSSSSGGNQFYGKNIAEVEEGALSAVQLHYSAVQLLPKENFDRATLYQMVDIDNNIPAYQSHFKRVPDMLGVIHEGDYLSLADWDKADCSVFLRNGVNEIGAPVLAPGKQVDMPKTTIDGRVLESRPDVGSYLVDKLVINHSMVAGKRVVFVDKYTSECGDGSSWATPIRFLQSAIDYLDEKGGGEVWVKEGTYLPNLSGVFVSGPRSYSITMRSGVELYGGFPLSMPSPGMEDRNPVLYRTILSGDIAVRGNYDDNSFHLVVFDENLTASSVLDGFVLSSANGYGDEIAHGGAVVVKSSFAEIRNSVLENNIAPEGAAVWADKPFKMTNCVVNNNEVEGLDAASLSLAPGSELMNVTVVMNKGIGVKLLSGKITNTVLWGNTGNPLGDSYDNVQVKGTPVITYSALSNLWEGNIFLSTLIEGENAPNFINPRLEVGVVPFGTYGTVLGGVAVFGPNCISALINGGTTDGAPGYDISGKMRDVATNDIGAYGNSCVPNNPKIRYVRAGGTGGGLSWRDAAGSLKQQVESLKGTGGEVWVAGGTYSPSDYYFCSYNGSTDVRSRFLMIEGVNVYGGFPNFGNPGMNERRPVSDDPRYKTILQAQEQSGNTDVGRVLTQMNDFVNPTTWDGFTMQHGSVRMLTEALTAAHGGGGGVKLMKGGRLVNTVVQNNRNDVMGSADNLELKGGGVYNAGGELVNCHIRGNEVFGSVAKINGTCNVYGAGIYMTSGSVYNCVVSHNKLSAVMSMPSDRDEANACGGGIYMYSGTLYNSTVTRNTVMSKGGDRSSALDVSGVQVVVGDAIITNCIVHGNTSTSVGAENKKEITGGSKNTITYSCGVGITGAGTIDKDPQFVDPDNGDFRLKETSPLINMGNTYPSGITLPATDMDDTERIKDCAIDMGAYERGAAGKIVPGVKNNRKVVYVTRYGAGSVDGSSWEKALCGERLQGAIDYLSQMGGGDVWVGVGMDQVSQGERVADFYSSLLADSEIARSNIFAVHPRVNLIGGFRGDEGTPDDRVLGRASSVVTILNGDINRTPENNIDDAYHVVVVFGSGMLDGFTVMNGNANHYMNPDYQNGGGGLVRKEGVFRNCYVKRCSALNKGGGVYVEDGGIVSGVVVTENDASLGGGIYAESGSKIFASTVVKNSGNTGGGIQFMFPASITGCVFWGNSAPSGKDVSGRTNLTYEFNHAGQLIQSYPMNYCAIENMKPHGDGNIKLSSKNEEGEDAPGFLDIDNADFFNFGWSLKPLSSLIDRGLNTGLPYLERVEDILRVYSLSKNDLAGNERVRTVRPGYEKAYMDVGAYESDTTIVLLPMCKDGVCRIYVTAVARGKADGSSWKNATADLQGALNYFKTSPTRGEVWVQGGYSYVPYRLFDGEGRDQRMLSFKLNSNVSLYGGFKGDAESGSGMISENSIEERLRYDRNQNGILEDFEFFYPTVFDGMINPADKKNYAYHVLYHDEATASDYVVVDGFTIINGNANGSEERLKNGGAIYANAPIKVMNCIFYSNSASGLGGAVYLGSSRAKSMIMNSSFGGNAAGAGGGAVAMKNGVLVNSNVFNNDAGEMGGGVYAENSEVLNTLITKNTGKQGSGLYVFGGKVTNVVVWGNEGGLQVADARNTAKITYTAVQDGEGITVSDVTNNLRLNSNNNEFDGPRFMAPTLGVGVRYFDGMTHWEVASYSPLVDKGDKGAYPAEYPQVVHQLKYQGSPTLYPVNRVENGRIDIGSYEYQCLGLKEDVNRMYVRTWENNSIGSDGSSWERATSDLQGAIEILERSTASGVKEIWVAKGEYIPTKSVNGSENLRMRSFTITSGGVKIYGGFPDDGTGLNPVMEDRNIRKYTTVLNGNRMDNYHVVRILGLNPVLLDGFVVQGGKGADENVSDGFNAFGSAVWMSNPAAVVNHCVFKDNEGTGGAVFMNGPNMRVENSLFLNNTGYPVYMENGYFLNNTVVNNSQGVLARGGEVRNNIMWGNGEPEQLTVEGTPVIMNNAFSGEQRANNTHLDAVNDSDNGPRFVAIGLGVLSDFELDCGSCLIDAGGDVSLTDGVDLASKLRVRGKGIDIGAYESMRGPIPAKPIYAGDTTTCQGVALVLDINNNGFSGTDIYWTSEGKTGVDVNLNKNPVTVSELLPGGEYLFEAVRVDMTTFCESKPEEVSVLIHSSPPVVLSAGKDVCDRENVELSFVPVKDAISYKLYEGSAVVTGLTWEDNKIVINRPSVGKHNYQLTVIVPKGVGEMCESLRSDTAGVTVHEIPTLINGEGLSDVVSGDVVYHVPQSNVPGAQFTWKRDAVTDNPASAGRDSIYEVLTNSSNTESISVAYWYQVSGNGCSNPTEYPIKLNIIPGIGTPTIESGYGECGVGYVVLNVVPAEGRQPSGYVVYKDGVEIGATAISVTRNKIRIPATLGVSAVYEVSASVKIGDKIHQSGKSTPVTLEAHPSVDAVSVTTTELEVCFGNNIVLDCSRAEEYRVYDGAELLGSELYKVVDNKITIYAPAVGKHSYGVVVVKRFEDGEVCVSSPTVTEISVDNTKDIQVKGNTTLNSNEMTDLQLSIAGDLTALTFVWDIVRKGPDISVTGGALSGSKIAMTLVNLGAEPQQVDFRVRYVNSGTSPGCAPSVLLTLTVNPLSPLQPETPGTDNQRVCRGDAIAEIVYPVGSGSSVTGLELGVSYRVENGRLIISGIPTGFVKYVVSSGLQKAMGSVTVKPIPAFMLGKRK